MSQKFLLIVLLFSSFYSAQCAYKSCGFNRECVPYYLCHNDFVEIDGRDLLVPHALQICSDYFTKCCDISRTRNNPNPPVRIPAHSTALPLKPPLPLSVCGYRNANGISDEVNADQQNKKSEHAKFAEFPWMVAILADNLYKCGGSLIASRVILTAAHCVQNVGKNSLTVRAGEWDMSTEDEELPYEERNVVEAIVHEAYDSADFKNDIAILIVDQEFGPWTEHIKPICLPETHQNFDYKTCFATGWGKMNLNWYNNKEKVLKNIELPIVRHDECQSILRRKGLGRQFRLHASHMCAGGERGKDTCKGDGGSPLMCKIPNTREDRFYLAGIVVGGIKCGRKNVPGLYANIPNLRDWINNNLQHRNIDFAMFTP